MPRSRAALLAFSAALQAACSGTVLGGGGRSAGDAAPADPGGGGDGGSVGGGAADGGLDPAALQTALQATVDRLQSEAAWRTPGSEVALAVQHLATGARASSRGGELYVSASSAKAWWVAAALDGVGVTAVEPYADPIFMSSDNGATGAVIDLIGPDAVNVYLWEVVGMGQSSTALTQWNYEATREASNSPRLMGSDNYTTADDAVIFLAGLQAGAVLDAAASAALQDWMTRAPRNGTGGWLTARLPAEPQASGRHKGGWLPPGCCSSDERYNTLNEVGLIDTPRGTYAVAILTHAGDDWYGRQAPYVELASCEIYRTVAAAADLDCARDGDPSAP
ncbi:MAG TPA: serine hydrolase [Kofleriaceae bacterium]|nr:serine hydrolase [Kofleriaceae bacterium]